MRPAIRNVCRRLVQGLWAAALTHCTLVSDFDVQECSSSADCELLTGEIRHCEQSRCVSGCTDNAHCVSVDPGFPLCQRAGGKCVALLDEDRTCSAASGYDEQALAPLTLQAVDVIGAFASTPRSSSWLSLQLAASEWNAPRLEPSTPRARPLLLLLCDDSTGSVRAAMPHLVEELGARALVAPLDERALRIALEPVASTPVFLLNPGGSSVSPESVTAGRDLLWYLGADYADTLPAYAQLLSHTLAVGLSRAAAPATFRLASVVGTDLEDSALSQAVLALLEIDGRTADGLIVEDRLRLVYPGPALPADASRELARLLDEPPQLVFLFMGPHDDPTAFDAATVIQALEARSAARGGSPPLYVLGPRSLDDVALQKLVAGRASLQSRVIGVRADPTPDATELAELQLRFVAAYPEASMRRGRALAALPNVYDALYLLAYGLFAAPRSEGVADAEDLLAGFRRVTAESVAEPVEMGPGAQRLDSGLRLLQSGASIQLRGASGVHRFREREHTRAGPPRPYVIGPAGQLLDADPSRVFDGASNLPD